MINRFFTRISLPRYTCKMIPSLILGVFLGVGGLSDFSAAAQEFSSPRPIARPQARTAVLNLQGAGAADVRTQSQAQLIEFASLWPTPRPERLHRRAIASGDALIAASGVSGAVSYVVADLQGDILEASGPVLRLPPASVAKAITGIYALEHLGKDHRFSTDILTTGPIENGTVQGDVILAGGADPTLDTEGLADLAEQLRSAGVTSITGQFYVYGGALPLVKSIDHEQTEHASYNPSISGLNLNYNRIHFEWRRQGSGYSLQMDARSKNYRPIVSMARMAVSDRAAPVFDHTAGETRDNWSVARGALGGSGARWLPVRLPDLYAGDVFASLAKSKGVTLPSIKRITDLPANGQLTAQHLSAPLVDIVRDMLKYSTNLTAEVIGMNATKARGLPVRDLATSAKAMSDWAKTRLGTHHLQFVDHSGLGSTSVVSTSDMVRALSAPGVEPLIAPLMKPIAVLDENRKRIRNSGISIAAKTGTLDFVSTLAGYVNAPDGRRMAFAIFTGDIPARTAAKAKSAEAPRGARTFNTRAKKLQQVLIQRWTAFYGS